MSRAQTTFCLLLVVLAAPTLHHLLPLTKMHLVSKRFLSVAFVGEKSSGKSSTLGRLLAELSPQSDFSQILQEAESAGKGDSKYVWLVDTTQEERESGATSALHKISLEGPTKNYLVKDGPGGLSNEALGAVATTDALVLFIDAQNWDTFLSDNLPSYYTIILGYRIKQFIVVVNTFDADESAFNEIEKSMRNSIKSKLSRSPDQKFVAINSKTGENIVTKSAADQGLSWYKGETLIETLESLSQPLSPPERPLRAVVDAVESKPQVGTSIGVVSVYGQLLADNSILACPSLNTGSIAEIDGLGRVEAGFYGNAILRKFSIKDVQPGVVISTEINDPCKTVKQAEVYLDLNGALSSLEREDEITLHIHNAVYPVTVETIFQIVDRRS